MPVLPHLTDRMPRSCRALRGCTADTARRFRLESEPARVDDTMTRAMQGVWKPCETTGAPKCPSKGRLIYRTDID
ncbi:hypothetical protein [Sphingomonas sp.]|uniref:hypothetical protein n=1 Tax=Sphingomonas sp. TaxID=28214 RepID=UPI001B2BDB4F|nr:hypothetical protein [Sphingomonas sp.]MBO9714444.1 hypothetical protein [Sphingomonas sp.]